MREAVVLALLLLTAPLHSGVVPHTDLVASELECLAKNIHFEAAGESKLGQIAVGHVTLNREKSPKFPRGICNVVYQKYQFSWVKQIPNRTKILIPVETTQLALDLLGGHKYKKDPTHGALYFHNNTVESFDRRVAVTIGNHIFYH